MAVFLNPRNDDTSTSTMWPYGANGNWIHNRQWWTTPLPETPEPLSIIERDRLNVARARVFHPTPYATPTVAVVARTVLVRRRPRSSWAQRWERSPLHKRALARR